VAEEAQKALADLGWQEAPLADEARLARPVRPPRVLSDEPVAHG
jgi:hypothetical protein